MLKKFKGEIEILSTHNLFCRKFAAVCGKISVFCPAYFLADDVAVFNGFSMQGVTDGRTDGPR